MPAVTPEFAKVAVPVTLAEPLKAALVQVTSPVMPMVRPVVSVAAEPVIEPAMAVPKVHVPLAVTLVVPVLEPNVIVVVEPDRPPVPKLIVFVLPEAVAPAWMFVVCETVDWPTVIDPVCDVPPIAVVPVVALVPMVVLELVDPLSVIVELAVSVVKLAA